MRSEGKGGGGKNYLWYRCLRSSVHGSAVVVRSCKNWEKDNKGNGTNLGLFRYLFPSKSAMYNQWVLQPGVFELPSKQCLLHVGNLIELYPTVLPNTTQCVGHGF